ncbi:N-alpha-acetyltransferase 60 isoform X1 [Macrosteles quadrilineatus]|uniref:N-alpha-acetyltransferase 60 isoform X1 n=2 Tax=Macrosteles quadrilineatus TaxID=74068 RepID=UPI0023E26C9A|nr:N-alpha-acetyltransferase 60 isoform X1 [Macrosteles quadrilineatus]
MDAFSWYAAETIPHQKTCMTKSVPLCSLANLQLRFLCPADLPEVRKLCQDWFPIDYPYTWYEDITSNPRFYSLAAVYEGIIIGLIVAEIKSYFKLNSEDKDILASSFGRSCCVGYILSLGVSEKHRRNGIASLLLENLVSHLTAPENCDCKAIFLHVLTANSTAIHFYEHRHFRLHSFLPYYYSIKGKSKDGFTYVLYINGGHPPWGFYDYIKYGCSLVYQVDVCAWVQSRVRAALAWLWPGVRRIVVENTTALLSH